MLRQDHDSRRTSPGRMRANLRVLVNIFLSSCVGAGSRLHILRRAGTAGQALPNRRFEIGFSAPEIADLILVVDIFEDDLYAGLRQNRVWQKWPEKSFAYYEGDSPPNFLHGLHSSASKALSDSGRFQTCAYPVHQLCYPNPGPSAAELATTAKDLLFSFAGRASHRVRRELFAQNFNSADVLVEDTSGYNHFAGQTENNRARPAALLGNSRAFKICAVPARSRHIHHAYF